MKYPLMLLIIYMLYFNSLIGQPIDTSPIYKMGFFDLSIGLDTRHDELHKYSSVTSTDYYGNKPLQPLSNHYASASMIGLSGRMQTSFVEQAFRNKMKRFAFGDVIAAEITTGLVSSNIDQIPQGFWAAYKIELGGGFIYRINKKNDIGLNISALKFSKDLITQYLFGSAVNFRYRYSRCLVELGITSGRKLYLGWTEVGPTQSPWQLSIVARYLLGPKNNVGIRVENFAGNFSSHLFTGQGQEVLWSLKVFYGLYF